MQPDRQITVLVAEDNDISRELIVKVLETQGFRVLQATDGGGAIDVVRRTGVDAAIVDQMMAPKGGFEFAEYLVAHKLDIPVIIITAHDSTDLLLEANRLGIKRVLQKPIGPERVVEAVRRVLRRKGAEGAALVSEIHETRHTPEQLMHRALELAAHNVAHRGGGPFGAIVADAEGRILGEGASGPASRADPTAHAEVMAIRQAAEKHGEPHLENCHMFCSCEPTEIGKALISSVGIAKVHYGLTRADIAVRAGAPRKPVLPEYVSMNRDKALPALEEWLAKKSGDR